MTARPFVRLRSGEQRSFRYFGIVRFGSLIGILLGGYGLAWLITNASLFADNRLLHDTLIVVGLMLIIGPLLMCSQAYLVSEEGITSRNLFRRRSLPWSMIEWVSLDRKLVGGRRYCVYTTRSRRWAYPKLAIPSWVRGFDELVFLIRDKVLSIKGGAP